MREPQGRKSCGRTKPNKTQIFFHHPKYPGLWIRICFIADPDSQHESQIMRIHVEPYPRLTVIILMFAIEWIFSHFSLKTVKCMFVIFRTIQGFQALIEKDWLVFGHKFTDRCGFIAGEDTHSPLTVIFRLSFSEMRCCGSGFGIRDPMFFNPWIRILDKFFPDPLETHISRCDILSIC